MIVATLLDYVENKDLNLKQSEKYTVILGSNLSEDPTSILWNDAFKKLNISAAMHSINVKKENVKAVVESLKEDKNFIGGLVVGSYKVDIAPFLDRLEPDAEKIGAVNCLYRDGNKIIGANTEGAAALRSIENEWGSIAGKSVLLIGTGAVGSAVAAAIAPALGPKGILNLANRTKAKSDVIAQKLTGLCQVESLKYWPVSINNVMDPEIIINCTSIGSENGDESMKQASPIATMTVNLDLNHQISSIFLFMVHERKKPSLFDVTYQPEETVLLMQCRFQGLKRSNGVKMNLEKNIAAFTKVMQASNIVKGTQDEIREYMNPA